VHQVGLSLRYYIEMHAQQNIKKLYYPLSALLS